MRFVSTRADAAGRESPVTFRQAVFTGLAPDGGLYVPSEQPELSGLIGSFSRETSFTEAAERLTAALFGDELDPQTIRRVTRKAFFFQPAVRRLDRGLSLLELFNGPTCAFKDFGASFLASLMEELLLEDDRKALILVATSGDTGGAVARAFHRKSNIEVLILYPSGRVSRLQEQQLTTLGDNVTALEVRGSFDDCQRLAKEAFLDRELREALNLSSANSINLGRLLPQAFYYIYGFCRLERAPGEPVMVCVPSGNFGNLTAGVYAWQWGLPVAGFIAATNINDVVPEYLVTGSFHPRASRRTISNAMDVGNPSNFERLLRVFHGEVGRMQAVIRGVSISDRETRETIRKVYEQSGVLLDPHTAVGVLASRRCRRASGFAGQILTLATAHPGKFPDVVEQAAGVRPQLPPALQEALGKQKRSTELEPRLEALKTLLLGRYV